MRQTKAYYNEIDNNAAAWLRELIKQGHIAQGDVDERDIRDITPSDIAGYTQVHFFAGIGVWSHALRCAGWPDDRPVWTGSCPCQPFSTAGRGGGIADERHLWPHWFHLISQCRPVEVFGEQVASKDGRAWFDTVQADMEALGFAIGAADLCAAGVGAPHIRQRLWFYGTVADSNDTRSQGRQERRNSTDQRTVGSSGVVDGMGNTSREPSEWNTRSVSGTEAQEYRERLEDGGFVVRPANAGGSQSQWMADTTHTTNGFWRDADWLGCRDGKFRPVEPGTFPLVDGASARVGRLRGYGNAIVPQAAQAFIEASQGW
jgi:DNA (cytosine-5)-methyltransferase 1